MQELEVTWGRTIAVWWLILWRGGIGGFVFGAMIGFIAGIVGVLLGASIESITVITTISGAVVGFLWFIVVVRMALRKHYGDFRLALVAKG